MIFQALFFFSLHLLSVNSANAQACSKVSKPVKYTMRSGDDFFSLLKTFNLEPVIGAGGSLERLQQANNLIDQTTTQTGSEILIPFNCEEQLLGWRLIDRGEDRLITTEKLLKTSPNQAVSAEPIKPETKTKEILDNAMPTDDSVDLDTIKETNTDISEALRYRMICNGEWTGTECITRYSAIFAIGGAWYNRYNGVDRTTGGEGTLLTKANPQFGLGWTNYWNKNLRTDLSFSVANSNMLDDVRGLTIDQAKKSLNYINAQLRYEIGKWGVKAGISQRERLFYRFDDVYYQLPFGGGVEVNAVPVLDLSAGLTYMLHQTGKFRFDGDLTFVSMQSTSTSGYKITPGTGLEIAAIVTHDRIREYIFGAIKYETSQQDTDILQQRATELGFNFGYAWKLKDW